MHRSVSSPAPTGPIVSPLAAMYVLPIVLIFSIRLYFGFSSTWKARGREEERWRREGGGEGREGEGRGGGERGGERKVEERGRRGREGRGGERWRREGRGGKRRGGGEREEGKGGEGRKGGVMRRLG